MTYRLIDEESKRILLEFSAEGLIPNEFKILSSLCFELSQDYF